MNTIHSVYKSFHTGQQANTTFEAMFKTLKIVILALISAVRGYPDFVGCSQDPRGEIVMGSETKLSSNMLVAFKIDDEPVACGDTITDDFSKLSIVHNLQGQYFIDVKGAEFAKPNVKRCRPDYLISATGRYSILSKLT